MKNNNKEKVLKAFISFKESPSMLELAKKVKLHPETVRGIMWKLVKARLVKVNKKAKQRKFYV